MNKTAEWIKGESMNAQNMFNKKGQYETWRTYEYIS